MPDDTKFEEFLRRQAAGYRADAKVPADELWARIEGDVAAATSPSLITRRTRVWIAAGAAIAAALILGIGIGRWSAPVPRDDRAGLAAHMRAAALDHLSDTEIFLTEVRANLRAGRDDSDRAPRSLELLARTRLLLRSPEPQSPQVTRLLQDVELLLAEIAALADSAHSGSADAQLLEETLRRNAVIPRIRTTLPPHRT